MHTTWHIMSLLGDLGTLLAGLIARLWSDGPGAFLLAVAIGTLLAAFAWWLAHVVALNFNRRFSFRRQHHLYCGVVAVLTLAAAVLFAALTFAREVAADMVDRWARALPADQTFVQDTFRHAYLAVCGPEHPTESRAACAEMPLSSGQVPLNRDASRLKLGSIYAEAAVEHFRNQHPLLSQVLWASTGIAPTAIREDLDRFFEDRPGEIYPLDAAIDLARREIRAGLTAQVPRVVLLARIALVALFLILQAIVFLLLIRAALADIKVRPAPRPPGGP